MLCFSFNLMVTALALCLPFFKGNKNSIFNFLTYVGAKSSIFIKSVSCEKLIKMTSNF